VCVDVLLNKVLGVFGGVADSKSGSNEGRNVYASASQKKCKTLEDS